MPGQAFSPGTAQLPGESFLLHTDAFLYGWFALRMGSWVQCNSFANAQHTHKKNNTPNVHRVIKVNHGGLTGLQEQGIVPRPKGLLLN